LQRETYQLATKHSADFTEVAVYEILQIISISTVPGLFNRLVAS